MSRRSSLLAPAVLVVLVLALAAGAREAVATWWPLALDRAGTRVLPGLRIDGVPVHWPGVRAFVADRAAALEGRRVRLVVPDSHGVRPLIETTLGDLGVRVDVDAVTSRALRLGHRGDVWTRAREADEARCGQLDVPLEPTVDAAVVFARLLPLKEDLDVPPVAARLDLGAHDIVPGRDGWALDLDGAVDRIARAARGLAATEIDLPMTDVAPAVTRASLARIDVSHVLARFSTYFSRHGDQAPRARNIEVAAAHVDGLVLEPGRLVSFNDVVGERSEENGFQKAFEIFKGEYVEGTGGGTCQVASTLHAAAFFGGLDIVERLPHSRPSAYIPAGLDATVVYPSVDLELRNPYDFPVVVHATVGADVVTMELLGADKPAQVTFGTTVLSTKAFGRKVEEDYAITAPKRKQKGVDGMELLRSRVIVLRGGARKVETSRDVYPPTSEVWRVPPGFDESSLPPLGEDTPPSPPADAGKQATGTGADPSRI